MSDEINAGAVAPASPTAPTVTETPAAIAPAAPATSPVKAESTPEKPLDEQLLDVWEKNHPPRAKGKFAGRNPAPPPPVIDKSAPVAEAVAATTTEQPAKAATEISPETPAQEVAAEPAKPAIAPPHAWTGEMKAKFGSLPPEVQTYVAQRESEAHKAITRAGEKVKAYEPIESVLQQFDSEFKRHGFGHAQGIAGLLNLQRVMDQNPLQGLVTIASNYGIDLQSLIKQQGGQAADAPRVDPLVSQLQSRLAQVEGLLTAKERQAQESEFASAQSQIAEFSKGKPYFEDVRLDMLAIMQGGRATTLDQAYDMAVYANPETRTRIQEDQRRADEAARLADQQAKAEAARRAGGINVRGSLATSSPKSTDEELWAIAQKAWPGARRSYV